MSAGPRASGIEVAVGGNWTAKAEYDYVDLARRTYDLTDVGLPRVNVDPNIHLFKLGLNYRLWETPPWAGPASVDGRTALAEPKNWNVHGQTTFIAQAYPRMRSPYEGTNSLPGGGQGRETWTTDVFLGWRLWQGGEFYFNPELAQGFGLNSTLGLAGFSNGEAQKGGAPLSEIPPAALRLPPDLRPRRRAGRRRRRPDATRRASATSTASRSRSAVSRSATISTATPTPRIPASTS